MLSVQGEGVRLETAGCNVAGKSCIGHDRTVMPHIVIVVMCRKNRPFRNQHLITL